MYGEIFFQINQQIYKFREHAMTQIEIASILGKEKNILESLETRFL
jgi:hypothetical protein